MSSSKGYVWVTARPEWAGGEGDNIEVVPKADYDELLRRFHIFDADVRRILKAFPEVTQRQLEDAARRADPTESGK